MTYSSHLLAGGLRASGALIAVLVLAPTVPASAQWPQWGGPQRDFTVETSGLVDSWPESGPPKLWQRELGDGYSSVVAEDGVLYTMYRKERTDDNEYTVALDAATGKTIWSYQHASPVPDDGRQFPGPNTTPLISGDLLYTVGRNAVMHCYNKKDGKVLWRHDLATEFGAVLPGWGYSSSPIAYQDLVIAAIGTRVIERPEGAPEETDAGPKSTPNGPARSLIAFDRETGKVVWKSQDFGFRFSSPILINFAGKEQLIALPQGAIVSVDPANGELLWRYPLSEDEGHVATPLWNGEDLLFCGTGQRSRVIKLTQANGKTVPEELWVSRKIGLGLATPVRIADLVVAPKGGQVPLLLGVDLRTGKRVWVQRGFAETTLVEGDGKVILLDQRGQLALATATPEGITVHSTWQIPEWSAETFTAPTLVGKTLYVRDRKHIMALNLGTG
ncbi:MAG: PQQ-like beta-propeller repeat protein [Planctomycetes bacterium]|nr:PQQ-like beta-propeller repeat protein [Planctomycetota bacterium]